MNTDVIARLAAANPVPRPARPRRHRRRWLVVAVAAACLVPAAYAAEHGLGIGNEGTSVPTSDVLPGQSQLDQALADMQVGETMQLLGQVNGVAIYAARNAAGHICFAIDRVAARYDKGVLCDLNDPGFPSANVQALSFPGGLLGIAADGVASVELVDADGNVIDSAPVVDNLFNSNNHIGMGVAAYLETFDANGNVVTKQKLPG